MKRIILLLMVLLLSASIAQAQDFCKGDFEYDGDVDADDVTEFLNHFGRSQFNNPCPPDGPSPVQKTGQTTSYTPYDDGALKKGVEWPNPRFTDNGNGTITDNLTGLIWLKNANCFGQRTWYEALSDANGLGDGQCGLTDNSSTGDWRLPNLLELESLRDMQYYDPPISNTAGTGQWTDGDPFTNVQSSYYWSSTSDISSGVHAFFVVMRHGTVLYGSKEDWWYIWPVRGGH